MNVPFVDIARLHRPLRSQFLAAFARVVDSGGYVQGAEVGALEAEFAALYPGTEAIAVSNGTAALHLSLVAAGIRPGDEVITVANTFIATAEAISMAGAIPVFADIARDGFLVDPGDVERRITPRTRAIVAVHLYGEIADMPRLRGIAERHGLRLIEDACQALGARQGGRAAGTLADAGCLSFYPTKNIGTVGEGGMVLTADPAIAARVRSLRDHGQRGRHVHLEPGFNCRMPELQAAALRVMLPHLDEWNERRQGAARRYRQLLGTLACSLPSNGTPGSSHVYHLYVIRSSNRTALRDHLESEGIGTAIHYPTPIHLQPAYRSCGNGPGSLPNTERAVSQILSLPMHPQITDDELAAVAQAIQRFQPARATEAALAGSR